MADRFQSELARRGRSAFVLGASVLAGATVLYYVLGCLTGMNAGYDKSLLSLEDDQWEITECIYAAAVTLTTVGYTDILGTDRLEIWRDGAGRYRWVSPTDPHSDPGFEEDGAVVYRDWSAMTRITSALLSLVGISFFLYVIAQITSFFVEGAYEELQNLRRTRRRLSRLSGHVIVCGAGEHGQHLVRALAESDVPCAVIDYDDMAVAAIRAAAPDVPVMRADATEEESLMEAGLAKARGVATVFGEDGMNVVAAVTARQVRPGIPCVSRGFGRVSAHRLAGAGCSVVISGRLAAMRMASEMVRPTAVDFLDQVLGPQHGGGLRLEDVPVGHAFAGHRIAESDSVGVVPLALRHADDGGVVYNPDDDEPFQSGDLLTVIGTPEQLDELRQLVASPDDPPHIEIPIDAAVLDAPHATGISAASPDALSDHFVIVGGGETGRWICRELHATHRAFVLVEPNPEVVRALRAEIPDLIAIEGDAQDPGTLSEAGVERALGLASTVATDRVNLLAVVTALQANPDLRAVSLAHDEPSERRLRRAGVAVVSKGRIGGRRMAAELIRPQLTGFLDRMLADPLGVRVESARVVAGAPAAGRALGDLDFWNATGVRPVAIRAAGAHRTDFIFDPEPHVVLEPESEVVVIADPEQLARVVALVGADW
jgi:voltage-gated potassium channel